MNMHMLQFNSHVITVIYQTNEGLLALGETSQASIWKQVKVSLCQLLTTTTWGFIEKVVVPFSYTTTETAPISCTSQKPKPFQIIPSVITLTLSYQVPGAPGATWRFHQLYSVIWRRFKILDKTYFIFLYAKVYCKRYTETVSLLGGACP